VIERKHHGAPGFRIENPAHTVLHSPIIIRAAFKIEALRVSGTPKTKVLSLLDVILVCHCLFLSWCSIGPATHAGRDDALPVANHGPLLVFRLIHSRCAEPIFFPLVLKMIAPQFPVPASIAIFTSKPVFSCRG
jgi:hypothetical protein